MTLRMSHILVWVIEVSDFSDTDMLWDSRSLREPALLEAPSYLDLAPQIDLVCRYQPQLSTVVYFTTEDNHKQV